jgi:hypothetical protein
MILEPYSSVLAETILRDAVSAQTIAYWKLTAVATFGAILSATNPGAAYDAAGAGGGAISDAAVSYRLGSVGFQQIIELLKTKGYLKALFDSGFGGNGGEFDIGLYKGTLDMCVPLACTKEGVDVLIKNDLLTYIARLKPCPSQASYLDDANRDLPADSASIRDLAETNIINYLSPVFRVFRAMLSSCPEDVHILEGCVTFLNCNEPVVLELLGLKLTSLAGLELTKAAVSMMNVVAAFKGSGASIRSSLVNSVGYWDSSTGILGVWYTPQLCALLAKLGETKSSLIAPVDYVIFAAYDVGLNPIPGLGSRSSANDPRGARSSKSSGTWWDAIQPCNGDELKLERTPQPAPFSVAVSLAAVRGSTKKSESGAVEALKSLNREWSAYDSKKLELGHEIVQAVAATLRSRSITLSARPGGGAAAFDISSVVGVFCACSTLLLNKEYADSSSGGNTLFGDVSSADWLMSADSILLGSPAAARSGRGFKFERGNAMVQASKGSNSGSSVKIERMLTFVTENLLCAIYSIVSALPLIERAGLASTLTKCMESCEKFPPHSFHNEIGRWISKLLTV